MSKLCVVLGHPETSRKRDSENNLGEKLRRLAILMLLYACVGPDWAGLSGVGQGYHSQQSEYTLETRQRYLNKAYK